MAKKFNAITNIADIGLITSPVTVEMVSVTAFVGGVGLPVALSGTSLLFFLLQQILHKNLSTCLP